MISSPCKTCEKRNLPKDQCIEKCKKIKEIQVLQSMMPKTAYSAVDGADTDRFRLAVANETLHCALG
ncbi:MAG: hypothetical protein GY874_23385 [Desulfobacteraceae bacterium]|nr:hypothetical protein [Desulfobacteraceae bacterium]